MDLGSPFVPQPGQRIARDESVATATPIAAGTQRVFLLSGGVFRRAGRLCIGWDYSDKLFEGKDIERFAELCSTEIETIMDALEGAS
jgi:hypothetical protein